MAQNNIYAPGLNDDEMGLVRFALFYTYEMLTDAISDGEGGLTIADRLDELRLLNHKLQFLDAIDFGEPTDG